jgi:hypothetical protein
VHSIGNLSAEFKLSQVSHVTPMAASTVLLRTNYMLAPSRQFEHGMHHARRLNLCVGDGERCNARPEGSGDVAIATAPVALISTILKQSPGNGGCCVPAGCVN